MACDATFLNFLDFIASRYIQKKPAYTCSDIFSLDPRHRHQQHTFHLCMPVIFAQLRAQSSLLLRSYRQYSSSIKRSHSAILLSSRQFFTSRHRRLSLLMADATTPPAPPPVAAAAAKGSDEQHPSTIDKSLFDHTIEVHALKIPIKHCNYFIKLLNSCVLAYCLVFGVHTCTHIFSLYAVPYCTYRVCVMYWTFLVTMNIDFSFCNKASRNKVRLYSLHTY